MRTPLAHLPPSKFDAKFQALADDVSTVDGSRNPAVMYANPFETWGYSRFQRVGRISEPSTAVLYFPEKIQCCWIVFHGRREKATVAAKVFRAIIFRS